MQEPTDQTLAERARALRKKLMDQLGDFDDSEARRADRPGSAQKPADLASHENAASFEPLTDDGFRGAVAARVAGISYRQLEYWARNGLVEPTAFLDGDQILYSERDMIVLKLVKRLLDTGVSLSQIITAVHALNSIDVEFLPNITLMSDGVSVFVTRSDMEVIDIVNRGDGIFGIAVSRAVREVRESLQSLTAEGKVGTVSQRKRKQAG